MHKNYDEYNDHELVYMVSDSNEDACDILYEKYMSIIEYKAGKYFSVGKKLGLEYKDLVQEGMIGLSEAIRNYRDNKDTKFSSFANICIERQILTVITSAKRKKHYYLNDSCSLDSEIDDSGKTLSDLLFDEKIDPSNKIEYEEEKDILYSSIYKGMSDFEKAVFDLKMLGLEYKEIATILEKSYKSVDSALQRIKAKVKKALEEQNND